MTKEEGLKLLRKAINDPSAEFREGQWEAIDSLVNGRKKLLVIERTGWGKSSVYFISTRILRDQGKGTTIIISPLLALMRNQVDAAERLGINAVSINSTNISDWEAHKQAVLNNEIDALLISPERLSNESFMDNVLRPIADRIGLFVVDEAHCISDWGHDFRPDYRRIISILKFMPDGMPILGTTATANDRVCEDIVSQLGNIEIIRGALTRKSISLQNIKLKDQASRLAWLKENIERLPGSGIIYTLTKRDAHIVTDWLIECDIEAAYYYSGAIDDNFEDSNTYRQYVEDVLFNNEIKVLVATSALGMGYDKPDLGFVVHYQAPNSIISYYQQVGRAGRAIDQAYGILLSGQEDDKIHEYFRRSAFPPRERVTAILNKLDEHDGLSVPELMKELNLRQGQIEQVLKYLKVEETSPIVKIGSKWKRAAVDYEMDSEKILRLTSQRVNEWEEVKEYIEHNRCLMRYLQDSLDDPNKSNCGKCVNCTNSKLHEEVTHQNGVEAALFLKHSEFDIKLKTRIQYDALSKYELAGNLPLNLRGEIGKTLSRWGDAGWGKIVALDKHNNHFRDELVEAFVEMINKRWKPSPSPTWVTCIPSHRHPDLVPSFSNRVAVKLGIPFIPVINKIEETAPQKEQENSYFQCKNLDGIFEIGNNVRIEEPVLLIDDAIDSGWTLTIATALLRAAGSGIVYPATLTSTSAN
ncbi:RecQ family ATP-dependent DNA helicase [Fulvivirga sp. 29W222]|uniref:DNA 3'-5' helicase n=1 Tax=Fulvivirga marina TaxID=2494733 RepID=A0A937FYW8_9BACT|nr:RecQ family ATP-dependent DNA helicase [Fulvivirga marina]MBL6447372.1 RecQ family ATP-dependent DNA helicase [Fulvivirga marina]